MTADYRTPGWTSAETMDSTGWTPHQHRQVACRLLDGNINGSYSEDAWNGEPPWRHYSAADDGDPEVPVDYAPYLAAIAHALLSISSELSPPPGQPNGGAA